MSSWLTGINASWRRRGAELVLSLGLLCTLSVCPATAKGSGPFLHKVQKGDTLWSITQRYKVSVAAVQECNGGLDNIHKIKVGEYITIPGVADGVVPPAPYAGLGRATSSASNAGSNWATSSAPNAGSNRASSSADAVGSGAVLPSSVFGSDAAKNDNSAPKPPSTIAERRRLAAEAAAAEAAAAKPQNVGSPPALSMVSPVEPGGGDLVSGGRWARSRRSGSARSKPVKTGVSGGTATKSAAEMIAFAKKFLGTPYVYGGDTPAGFDCSGFVQSMCRYAGVNIPRVADDQYYKAGTPVPVGLEQAGDLVFFETDPSWPGPSHVGICLGGGEFIHASSSGSVRINRLDQKYYKARFLGSKRVL